MGRLLPAVAFFPDDFATDYWRTYLGEQLVGFAEPSLHELGRDPECVTARFLWLRTFHAPVCVRLELAPETTLIAKTASTKSGFERPREVSVRTRIVTHSQAEYAADAVRAALLTAHPRDRRRVTVDGASWVLEHVRHGVYRVAELNSPRQGDAQGAFRAAAWHLIELAGADLVEGPVY